MPNLQLSFQDAADIASWILSVPGEWPVKVEVARRRGQGGRRPPSTSWSSSTSPRAGASRTTDGKIGRGRPERGRRLRRQAQHRREALLTWARRRSRGWAASAATRSPASRTPSRSAPPLNDWGLKSPARLDFGHIHEYLEDQKQTDRRRPRRHRPVLSGEGRARDPDGLPLPEAAPARGATTT